VGSGQWAVKDKPLAVSHEIGEQPMNRCFGWAALVVAGVLLAVASGSYHKTVANSDSPSASEGAAGDNGDAVAQLREIKKQLKEINEHLHSGVTKVMIPMNPNKRD
jgi:hypothetical protein